MNECVLALGVEKMQPGCGKAHIIGLNVPYSEYSP
jgi:hypothetical protein